jgi:hypothetical protein
MPETIKTLQEKAKTLLTAIQAEQGDAEELGTQMFEIVHSLSKLEISTPDAIWRVKGEEDPHGAMYNGERAALMLGNLTDDELANAVYIHGNAHPHPADIIAGKAISGIVYLTAAKERIRWLSRKVHELKEQLRDKIDGQQH